MTAPIDQGSPAGLVLGYANRWRGALATCAALLVAQSGVTLALPWLAGRFAGDMLSASGAAPLLLVALFGLLALLASIKVASAIWLGRTAEHILADLRTRLYDHLQALPLGFFHRQRHGEIVALLTNDVARLAGYVTGTLPALVPLALTLVGAVLLMGRIDMRLTIFAALAVPFFFVVTKLLGRNLRAISRELQAAHAQAIAVAEENLGMLPIIKGFTREVAESARYAGKVRRIFELRRREQVAYALLGPSVELLAGAALLSMLWMIGTGSQAKTPAEMVSFLLYAVVLVRPVSGLADFYGQTRQVRGALDRLDAVLREPPEAPARPGAGLPAIRGEIRFDDVSFAYPGRPPTLAHLQLRIGAGEIVALTGPNGAGKSTMAHLLLRFMRHDAGTISVDGIDIAGVDLASLRRQVAIVTQHVLLFNGSVHDNIAWGREGAAPAEVQAAARSAQAHAFISSLPDGYDTMIGDQGVLLSGGQRQRIALARALLKDPRILILDEATAMFDAEGERSFVADCRASLAGRTVLLITHSPVTLALANRVVRLEDGQVTEVAALRAVAYA